MVNLYVDLSSTFSLVYVRNCTAWSNPSNFSSKPFPFLYLNTHPLLDRRLRDSTLLNLSLTSREVSLVSLPVLYRNITATPLTSRLLLPCTRNIRSPFIHTRSLRLGLSQPTKETEEEWDNKYMTNVYEASHPDLNILREEVSKLHREINKLSGAIPESIGEKASILSLARAASMTSLIIETMPNLQLLETEEWVALHFVRLHFCPKTGARFSRPLSGLSNLKILKMGKSTSNEINATNCVWLMLFLPNLTHLKIFCFLRSKDEKFFRDHQEVLVGKSKVTHLKLDFRQSRHHKDNSVAQTALGTSILEKLLSATKALVELQLRNFSNLQRRDGEVPSLLFLRSLKSSSTLR